MIMALLRILQSTDDKSVCSLSIPQSLSYEWHMEKKSDASISYCTKLAETPAMPLLINTSCATLEERLRIRAQKIFLKVKRVEKRMKDEIKAKYFSFTIYNEDILQPAKQLSKLETDHRYVYERM